MKLLTLQILQIFYRVQDHGRPRCTYPSIHFFLSQDHGRLPAVHISKHSPFSWCWNSQDHGRLPAVHISKHSPFSWCWNSQDHGRLPGKHISKHSQQKLAHVLDSLVHTGTRGLWARPPVLTPVPSQAIHSRGCLNSHHSDTQGTAQKSPCVNTNVLVTIPACSHQRPERHAHCRRRCTSAARSANLYKTAQASCRPPGTRTGRGRHPTPPALSTRAENKSANSGKRDD